MAFVAPEVLSAGHPRWLPDASAAACMRCFAMFTVTLRRHHCRLCGEIMCARCTRRRYITGFGELKVCSTCQAPGASDAPEPASAERHRPQEAGLETNIDNLDDDEKTNFAMAKAVKAANEEASRSAQQNLPIIFSSN